MWSISSVVNLGFQGLFCPVTVSSLGHPVSLFRIQRKRGDRVGLHWRIPNTTGKRAMRHVLIDTNYWKTFVHARLA
jgi:hypothetical protein